MSLKNSKISNKKPIKKKVKKKLLYNEQINIKQDQDHNESIKDLIFDDNIMGYINEEENTDNILNSINFEINEKKENSNLKENLEKFEFDDLKENSERNILENNSNFKLETYFNFENFPIFEDSQNQIYLKACSLFNNSILLENDYFKINFEVNKSENSSDVNIKLLYFPKINGSEIKIEIINPEKNINFQNIEKQLFNNEIEQNLNVNDNLTLFSFPFLNVYYYFNSEIFEFKIPVPISINKFTFSLEIDSDFIQEYLFNVS